MQAGAILKHTETIRAELAKRFAGNPKGELDCWVETAHQREAMVVQVYDAMSVGRRIPDQAPAEAATVSLVRDTIGSIWAQETSHATLMSSLRKLDAPSHLQLAGGQGTIEGLITAWATSQGLLGTIARATVGLAREFKAAPAFTAELGAMSLAEFFRFSEELELTASNGYARILELVAEVENGGGASGFGVVAQYEFATTLAEERFHQAVFQLLGRWLKDNENELTPMPPREMLSAIRQLVDEHLRMSKVQGLPESASTSAVGREESLGEDQLVSDGGLGDLFSRYDSPLFVASRPAA